MKNVSVLFKASAVLWIIWGLVHIMAGAMTMKAVRSDDISAAVIAIADGMDPQSLTMAYPQAVGAVIGQHGFNLLWIGLTTLVSALFVWKGNKYALFLAALCGGLADLGYFLFLDLGGFINFVPGTIMTLISSVAILLSFYAHFTRKVA